MLYQPDTFESQYLSPVSNAFQKQEINLPVHFIFLIYIMIYFYTWAYACTYVCKYVYSHVCIYTYACTYVHICIHVYLNISVKTTKYSEIKLETVIFKGARLSYLNFIQNLNPAPFYLFINSIINIYSLNLLYVSDTVLDTEETVVNKLVKSFALLSLFQQRKQTINNKINNM